MGKMKKKYFLILCAYFALNNLLYSQAYSQEPEKRLIETNHGATAWMTQDEVYYLSKVQHSKGKCGGFFDITDFPNEPDPSPLSPYSFFSFGEPKQQPLVHQLMPEHREQMIMLQAQQLY